MVVVRGPDTWPVVRRKANVYGVWLNRDSVRFRGVPTYYAIQSNRPPEEIADQAILERYEIGLENLSFKPTSDITEQERAAFADALIRLRLSEALFNQAPTGVSFLNEYVFSTRINLPSNISTGPYRIELYLFRDGALLSRESMLFGVRKTGLEAMVSTASVSYPVLYGIASITIAMLLGWACRTDVPAGLGSPRLQRRRRA